MLRLPQSRKEAPYCLQSQVCGLSLPEYLLFGRVHRSLVHLLPGLQAPFKTTCHMDSSHFNCHSSHCRRLGALFCSHPCFTDKVTYKQVQSLCSAAVHTSSQWTQICAFAASQQQHYWRGEPKRVPQGSGKPPLITCRLWGQQRTCRTRVPGQGPAHWGPGPAAEGHLQGAAPGLEATLQQGRALRGSCSGHKQSWGLGARHW